MVKLSKGCLPCRVKRTKCDQVLPSCTQCVRKNRKCSGYRNETDLLFRNETPALVQRTRRKRCHQESHDAAASTDADSDASPSCQLMQVLPQQPSRRAFINEEAMVHYMGMFNDKVIAASGPLEAGFDYLTGVIQADLRRGEGPVAEMATACGLASLGNSTGSEELVTKARVKHLKVIRQLAKQLQDNEMALSDSSITTCILLATFELITAEEPLPNGPFTTHLFGAVKLLALRGTTQMQSNIGYSIWLKLRNMVLADCLRLRQRMPAPIAQYMELDAQSQRDYYPDFFMVMDDLCSLRADLRDKGFVDEALFRRAQKLHFDYEVRCEWMLEHVAATRPSAEHMAKEESPETTYRFITHVSSWVSIQCMRVLISDIFLDWARAEHARHEQQQQQQQPHTSTSPGPATDTTTDSDDTQTSDTAAPPTLAALEAEATRHAHLCDVVQDGVSYFLAHLARNKTATRIHAGIHMLWPLGMFLSLSTTSPARLRWVAEKGRFISDRFSLRMGNIVAEAAEEMGRELEAVVVEEESR